MNKKYILLFVILLICSLGFVSAHETDSLKKDSDYEILLLEKIWQNDEDSLRPDYIVIHIFGNGELKNSEILTKDNDWKPYGRVVLPVYDDNGLEIDYTFKESGADDYNLTAVKNDILDYSLINVYDDSDITSNNTVNETHDGNTTANGTVQGNITDDNSNHGNHSISEDNKLHILTPDVFKNSSKPVNHTVPLLNTGNSVIVLVICIIIVVGVIVYRKR